MCHLLADFLEAIKKDFEKASKVYKSNCDDYKYGKSCLKFGHYSFLGKGKVSEKGDAKMVCTLFFLKYLFIVDVFLKGIQVLRERLRVQ